jgi:hypothetical protein
MNPYSLERVVMSANDTHDIVVYSSDKRPALVVEVRATKDASPERALAARQHFLQRDPLLRERFFLLASSSAIFLWEKNASADAAPKTAALKDVVRDYGGKSADRKDGPSPEGLLIIMYFWLDDLAIGVRKPKETSDADQLLVSNGVYERIRNGIARREACA